MSEHSVPEDDGIKEMREGASLGDTGEVKSGVSPKKFYPRRMKGFYRALKRGEPWAIKMNRFPPGTFQFLLEWHFNHPAEGYLMEQEFKKTNSFLANLPKFETFGGCYLPVPFKTGKEK